MYCILYNSYSTIKIQDIFSTAVLLLSIDILQKLYIRTAILHSCRAVFTNGHTGHVPEGPRIFSF